MSDVKHTPGSWYISTKVWDRNNGAALHGETPVVRMNGPCDAVIVSLGAAKTELEANARLIAAAPDLLEALKAMLESDGSNHESDESLRERHAAGYWPTFIPILLRARAAIAKAEGREP